MNDLQSLTTFLGWCSVINLIALCIASLALILAQNLIAGIHSRMFDVSKENLSLIYIQYMSNYKIAIVMLNLVPYLALRIMA